MMHSMVLMLAAIGGADARSWDFEQDAPGEPPKGSFFDETAKGSKGVWRVVESDGGHVLAQLGEDPDEYRFTMAVVKRTSYQDVKLSVRVKAVKGKVDQAGGLVWRYQNSENYLVARLDVLEKSIRLYRFVRGT